MKINPLLKKIITFVFVIACYAGLYYVSRDHFDKLSDIDGDSLEYNVLVLAAVGLMTCLNWFLEAVKWKTALSPVEKISLRTSVTGVLRGIPLSVFTPNRVGEALGRPSVLKQGNRISGSLATVYCGLSQMPVMMFCGVFSCLYFALTDSGFTQVEFLTSSWFIVLGFSVSLLTALCFLFPQYVIPFVRRSRNAEGLVGKLSFFCSYTTGEKLRLVFFSFLRYFVYSAQYCFAIVAFGVEIGFLDALMSVFLIYVLMSFVPRPALLELGVRCTSTVFVLSKYTSDFSAPTVSSVFIWCVNLLIPALLGAALYLFEKKVKKNS